MKKSIGNLHTDLNPYVITYEFFVDTINN